MTRRLLLATQNQKKARELREIVGDAYAVETLDDVGLADLDIVEDGDDFATNARIKADAVAGEIVAVLDDVEVGEPHIVEDGDDFATNARIKADAVAGALMSRGDALPFAILADDSGIVVDALGGAPGVRSARFAEDAGAGAGDADNNALLLTRLTEVPDPERTARFACHIVARLHDETWREAFGTVEGTIARDERGAGGFGYDPLFCPLEAPGQRMAELSAAEKHRISHRGRALREVLAALPA